MRRLSSWIVVGGRVGILMPGEHVLLAEECEKRHHLIVVVGLHEREHTGNVGDRPRRCQNQEEWARRAHGGEIKNSPRHRGNRQGPARDRPGRPGVRRVLETGATSSRQREWRRGQRGSRALEHDGIAIRLGRDSAPVTARRLRSTLRVAVKIVRGHAGMAEMPRRDPRRWRRCRSTWAPNLVAARSGH